MFCGVAASEPMQSELQVLDAGATNFRAVFFRQPIGGFDYTGGTRERRDAAGPRKTAPDVLLSLRILRTPVTDQSVCVEFFPTANNPPGNTGEKRICR